MKKQTRFNTDAVVTRITTALLEDLNLGSEYIGDPRLWSMKYVPLDPYEFKKHYQVTNLLAKYIFSYEDVGPYETKCIESFIETQEHLKSFSFEIQDNSIKDVIMYARGIIQETLREYDLDEHLALCYYPKKASVGNGLKRSTLAAKWKSGLTGSIDHCEWFTRIYKPWHSHAVGSNACGSITVIDQLQATLAAKRWNKKRMICPNSGIGGLYSNGLGRLLENRLLFLEHDLSLLPDLHREYARRASLSNNLGTIDQRTASDNISVPLLRLLFPRRWCAAIEKGRISTIGFKDGTSVRCETLSTMGIGFTFPLQTLIFLALAKGCLLHFEASGGKCADRTVSCFGDDLIAPKELRNLITLTYVSLGLEINQEKTFWNGPFRESCGGDYYHGCNVRPAFIPTGGVLTRLEYLSFLYKTFNLLKGRWSQYEIPCVLHTILQEIRSVGAKRIHTVPLYFGDDAGLKLDLQEHLDFKVELPSRNMHGSYSFWRLAKKPNLRRIDDHDAYYWYSIQFSGRFLESCEDSRRRIDRPCDFIDGLYSHYTPSLELVQEEKQPKNYRSKLTGKKLKKTYSVVAQPGDNGRTVQEQAFACTWVE